LKNAKDAATRNGFESSHRGSSKNAASRATAPSAAKNEAIDPLFFIRPDEPSSSSSFSSSEETAVSCERGANCGGSRARWCRLE
jgi:hypothetical protein